MILIASTLWCFNAFIIKNSTFYEIPKIERVKSWRKIVPTDFEFSVRCNKKLTHELKFESIPESFKLLDKMIEICDNLNAEILHFQTPPSFNYNRTNSDKFKDFISSTKKTDIRIALETRNPIPLNPSFVKNLQDLNIIHCVDLLKGIEPVYNSDVLYTRIFGKGFHNIYQPLDNELKQVDQKASREDIRKAVIIMHSNRMFKDATRFKIYKESGEFPKVTRSIGVDSLAEVLKEDAIFPSSKNDLVNHQGWKVIDLTPTKRVRASDLLEKLPEKVYYGIDDIVQVLGS